MSETSQLVKPALVALCKRWPDGVWVRRNVGAVNKAYRSKRTGAVKHHHVRFNMAGMADIYGIWHGIAWELEAKLPGEVQSPEQVNWQAAVERAEGIYIVFNDVGDLLAQVDRRWRYRMDIMRQSVAQSLDYGSYSPARH